MPRLASDLAHHGGEPRPRCRYFRSLLDLGQPIPVTALEGRATRTIFLTNAWTGESPADLSILVHEMVHHLQNLSDRSYPCSVAREKLAYEAQDRWLRLFDRTLASEFEIDPLTLKVSTTCWR